MIASQYKIPKHAFPAVMKGPSIQGSFFRVITTPLSGIHPNIAVVIAKKYAKHAVIRNSLKRSVFRTIYPLLSKLPHISVVLFMVKQIPRDVTQSNREYQRNLNEKITLETHQLLKQIIKKYAGNS